MQPASSGARQLWFLYSPLNLAIQTPPRASRPAKRCPISDSTLCSNLPIFGLPVLLSCVFCPSSSWVHPPCAPLVFLPLLPTPPSFISHQAVLAASQTPSVPSPFFTAPPFAPETCPSGPCISWSRRRPWSPFVPHFRVVPQTHYLDNIPNSPYSTPTDATFSSASPVLRTDWSRATQTSAALGSLACVT